ncbi:hypothetical protein K438DRAFT_1768310 [Mycena galopus ATCC 62051]|nr:hypothetical protein K438DRAFT_1768310 [Mycena galopus ATCC 62051]
MFIIRSETEADLAVFNWKASADPMRDTSISRQISHCAAAVLRPFIILSVLAASLPLSSFLNLSKASIVIWDPAAKYGSAGGAELRSRPSAHPAFKSAGLFNFTPQPTCTIPQCAVTLAISYKREERQRGGVLMRAHNHAVGDKAGVTRRPEVGDWSGRRAGSRRAEMTATRCDPAGTNLYFTPALEH